MKYAALALMIALSACAHKADLKKPSEIRRAQEKADAKAAKKAEKNVAQQEKEERAQEAVLPMYNQPVR